MLIYVFSRYMLYYRIQTYVQLAGICLVLLFLPGPLAWAQSWRLAVTGGPSFSRINSENVQDEISRKGYHIGLLVDKALGQKLHATARLLYSAQGATLERSIVTRNSSIEVAWENNLNYLNLPVTARYIPFSRIHIEGGLYMGYLAGASISREGDQFNTFTDISKDNLQAFDWGIVLGSGFQYQSLILGFRWQRGAARVARSGEANRVLAEATHSAWHLYLACFLPRKKKTD